MNELVGSIRERRTKIKEMKVYVSLDQKGYTEKPVKEYPIIKNREKVWREIEISELADKVGNQGYTIVPAHLVGGKKSENCVAMQLFMLDFDDGISFADIKQRSDFWGLKIAFAYHTFSSSREQEKFRIAFAYEYLIDDPFVIKVIIAILYRLFPEADRACKNLDRMFLGGKKLIYIDESAHFALMQLLLPFLDTFKSDNNFKRNIEIFCRREKIFLFNSRPLMGDIRDLQQYQEIDDFMDSVIIHIIRKSTKSSFFIAEDKNNRVHQSIKCRLKSKKLNLNEAYGCQLLNDFMAGRRIDHMGKFAIATNLLGIVGGETRFLEVLRTYYDEESVSKWERDIFYLKGYLPKRCSEDFCPYYKTCENAGTILKTLSMDRKVYREEQPVYTLEEAMKCMEENLQSSLASPNKGIHLIKAQTGLGKTAAYIRLVRENPEEKFLIAVPTIKLKEEVGERMLAAGIPREEIYMTVSVSGNMFFPEEIQEAIAGAHKRGLHNKAKKIITEYLEELKKDGGKTALEKECQQVLEGVNAITDERVIVTTHAFLSHMPEDFLKNYTIIIDEDILQLHMFNHMESVSLDVLTKLAEAGYPFYSDIANRMISAEEDKYYQLFPNKTVKPLEEEQLAELECQQEDNVNDLVYAGAFVKMLDRTTGEIQVKYFCPQKLYPMKYIILSATMNPKIYRIYFKDCMEVYTYPSKDALYKGKLIQYTYHSLGRRDLANKKQVFYFLEQLTGNHNIDIITFKAISSLPERTKVNDANLHFGNSTGVNQLSGMDLGIIGTPFKAPEAYKLVACYLGAEVNRKIDERPKVRRVEYKGFSFLLTTYEEPILREVQMYSIESELEQCIGRARLLRNDCTVYVFSCFPCEQAQIHIRNYLNNT